jgi:hypothetical protein
MWLKYQVSSVSIQMTGSTYRRPVKKEASPAETELFQIFRVVLAVAIHRAKAAEGGSER